MSSTFCVNKKIYDSVHGFIRFNDLESELIDSLPFQRLHHIHQLGIAYLVYPGATHTRFEHSLGVMELATRIFDGVTSKFLIPEPDYWRQVIRFASLCHDLGHLPFSHVAESTLLGKEGHEKWTLEIIKSAYLAPIWKAFAERFGKQTVVDDIVKIALGESKLKDLKMGYAFSPVERALCQVVSGDFFGADRIDYLLRDAQCTGVSYGLLDYHQLIEMLCILPIPSEEGESLKMGIEENGIESCEALLLARHFMHQRVYQYSSVKAYSFHLARFMRAVYGKENFKDLETYLSLTDNEVHSALRKAALNPEAAGHRDALALWTRHHRFKAIQLPLHFTEEMLLMLKRRLHIPDEAIAWQLSEEKQKRALGLAFSVLTERKGVVPANHFSKIVIPAGTSQWVYIAREYEEPLLKSLEVDD